MNKLFCYFVMLSLFGIANAFSQPLSKKIEQRFLSFCELYSTVKYYYPDPNLQDFPWDAFAYEGYKISTTSKNDKVFIQKMDSLFSIIVPGVQISKKEFDIKKNTPDDIFQYPITAFWQHQIGLGFDNNTFSKGSLNYIYKKSFNDYKIIQMISPKAKEMLGKKLRISLLAKIEDNSDSIEVFSFNTIKQSNSKEENVRISIKVVGNEWKRYAVETELPNDIVFSRLTIYHPPKGTVYIDDLKFEVYNNGYWEDVEITNCDFEEYTSLGKLGGWESQYVYKGLAIADSINAQSGKYCLKLPVVEDEILYSPIPIEKPFVLSLTKGYKAHIPLQLYANDTVVFPSTNKLDIKEYADKIQTNQDKQTANQQAIAIVMQIWSALYQDYPYRETNFKNKIDSLLLQTIERLETDTITQSYEILTENFLLWINDPHLRLEGKFQTVDTVDKKVISIPAKLPNPTCLTETQCVVTSVLDNVTNLQVGDVILQINDINIDSVLLLYRKHNISRYIQSREIKKLMVTYGKSEMKVQLLRNDKIQDVVFSTYTRQKRDNIMLKEEEMKYQDLQDSLKETKDVFYLNTMYPPNIFNSSIMLNTEKILNQYHTTDSLVTELNHYKALILDVRGRPGSIILHYFNECMGIDLNRGIDISKTAFYPVAQFKRDTLDYLLQDKREEMLIHVPIYVLIDYNTISAPERALVNLKKSGRATFIGSNTAGAAGPVCKTNITNNITLVYTTGQVVGFDDNPMSYQGTGIAPDIYVYPTPQGIAEGRDEVLEKAIEIALQNIQEKQ